MALDLAHEKTFWFGFYEPEVERVIRGLALDGLTAWDIGAHAGYFSLMLALQGARVLAVEANPETAARLRRNAELNHAAIDVVEVAVAGEVAEVRFEAIRGQRRSQSGISPTGSIAVQAVTLDWLVEKYGEPSFVKLDIEGAELAALTGASKLLAARPTILCEVHRGKRQRAAIEELLENAGYTIRWTDRRVLAEP